LSNLQNQLKGGGYEEDESKTVIELVCLADKTTGVAIRASNQNRRPHPENNNGGKREKTACGLPELHNYLGILKNRGK
jgi:hypothetical protein